MTLLDTSNQMGSFIHCRHQHKQCDIDACKTITAQHWKHNTKHYVHIASLQKKNTMLKIIASYYRYTQYIIS